MSEKTDMQVEENKATYSTALPEQKAFFEIPARLGHACPPKPRRRRVPVAEEPLGYDHERSFEQHYPRIELPFQLVDTVETGIKRRYENDELSPNGLNRLFFGDLSVRQVGKNEVRVEPFRSNGFAVKRTVWATK